MNYFRSDDAMYRAFEFAAQDMISGRKTPNYDGIIQRLNEAIAEARSKTGQLQFEWPKETSATVISDHEYDGFSSDDDSSEGSIINPAKATRTIPIQGTRSFVMEHIRPNQSPPAHPIRMRNTKLGDLLEHSRHTTTPACKPKCIYLPKRNKHKNKK